MILGPGNVAQAPFVLKEFANLEQIVTTSLSTATSLKNVLNTQPPGKMATMSPPG